jgi:hypothetical protein
VTPAPTATASATPAATATATATAQATATATSAPTATATAQSTATATATVTPHLSTSPTPGPTATPTPPPTSPPPSGAGGTINLQWQPDALLVQYNLHGLAANTTTQGFIVPGTCGNPGGTATFRTQATITDESGNASGQSTHLASLPSGVQLPKSIEVVQNRQTVLCGDTEAESSPYPIGSGLDPSGSLTITLHPVSEPAPKQVHSGGSTTVAHSQTTVTGPHGAVHHAHGAVHHTH